MSDERDGRDDEEHERDERDDPDREAILARRRKLIAVALGGLTLTAPACAEPCLRVAADGGPDAGEIDAGARDAGMDAEPVPCLGAPLPDAGPDAGERDAGEDAGSDLDGSTDAEPMACLRMAPPADGGDGDASA